MKQDYLISVIIPIYNAEKYLEECLESVYRQTMEESQYEIVAVDDGSTDGSREICKKYENKENFQYIYQENAGVSRARNHGIQQAKGKYLLFLDSDDFLAENTLSETTAFFEKCYDEVDILTYPLYFMDKAGNQTPHFRNRFLTGEGVYKISNLDYLALTSMNVVVKNRFSDNPLFLEGIRFDEDIEYCAENVLGKNGYAYIDKGAYIYRKHGMNVTSNGKAYYSYADFIYVYQYLLGKYKNTENRNLYMQSLLVNELGWKITSDVILPYHYKGEEYQAAMKKISEVFQIVGDDILFHHPNMNVYKSLYCLRLFGTGDLTYRRENSFLSVYHNEKLVCAHQSIDIVLNRFQVLRDEIELIGYLKSPIFLFSNKPKLFLKKNREKEREMELFQSSWSYFQAKDKTALFWGFHIRIPLEERLQFTLLPSLDGEFLRYHYYFMPQTIFNARAGRNWFTYKEYLIEYENLSFRCRLSNRKEIADRRKACNAEYFRQNKKFWLVRKGTQMLEKRNRRIWLYYDCKGVKKDNGYYQFIHDFEKRDGIERYYVTNNDAEFNRGLFSPKQKKHVIQFGSPKHKFYYLLCEKVITAFIEIKNYMPYDWNTYAHYMDFAHFEVIYLQHGILHAHMPWKYSLDRQQINREVISTTYEYDNFTENYVFDDKSLIRCGMPRYDHIDTDRRPKKKILYAPSWRNWLIGTDENGDWAPIRKSFLTSVFFTEVQKFLTSPKLHQLLQESGYVLELKLHPIFSVYRDCFDFLTGAVSMAEENVDETEYAVCITDFSSFYFDFLYLKRDIIYFVPDRALFDAGLNIYRELDIPYEDGFGPYTETAEELIGILEDMLGREERSDPYREKKEGLFYYYDNHQCDRIYEELMK